MIIVITQFYLDSGIIIIFSQMGLWWDSKYHFRKQKLLYIILQLVKINTAKTISTRR